MGAVAEWSKALLVREKINENQKNPGSPPPDLGKLKKALAVALVAAVVAAVVAGGPGAWYYST